MSNLTGSPFSPWVKTQVDLRQKSLGKYSNIPSQDLQFYTTKSPFLRLASSVNLTNIGPTVDGKPSILTDSVLKKITKGLGISESEIQGSELAKKFILQGGVINGQSQKLQKGLNDGNSIFNGSYGWGGTTERGFVPMPGITGADVTYYSNGSLSRTTINVKLFSKEQFALFDVLYLRPGYTLLMEFGWSQYLDNETGNLVSMNEFYSDPLSKVLNADGNVTQYEVYNSIKKEKQIHSGNYEAVFGKISKFSWNFNFDGSYDCTIQLTSMGDIIESLKVNISDPQIEKNKLKVIEQQLTDGEGTEPKEKDPNPPLIANADKTIINRELFKIYESCQNAGYWSDYIVPEYVGVDEEGKTPKPEDLVIPNGLFTVTGATTDSEENQARYQVFIKYGAFLAFIQSKILLYTLKDNSPIASFDMNFTDLNNDENIILKIPGGFSANPNICLIPYSETSPTCTPPGVLLGIPNSKINEKLLEGSWEYSTYLGRISQILVNINHIAQCLDTAKQSEGGDINLLDFLKSINSGIIESLGNINSFEIRLDDDTPSFIKFIEDIPQRREDGVSSKEEYTRFNVYGVKPGIEGSFVKNITFTSELSNDFASMISIGAQANSNQVSGTATSFSNYSAGLIDRIIEDKLTSTAAELKKPSDGDEKQTIKGNFDKNINPSENSLFSTVYGGLQWTNKNTNSLVSHNKTHAGLVLGALTSPKESGAQLQAPFFLPFNLNLEIDGLSGIKLFQKFLMNDSILPISYADDGVDLQVKGVNHKITPGSWTTNIDTLSVPASNLSSVRRPPQMSSTIQITSQSSPGQTANEVALPPANGTALPPPPGVQPPEDEKLRLRLTRIMDDGTQTLGMLDVLAEDETTVLYTLATSELPWKGNKNKVSCIPVDNYRVKSHVSGKHGNCFWLIGNEQGGYAFDKLFGNGYIRSSVLIHMSPKAPGWLLGCIGPGFKFNTSENQKGRQQGTGKFYLDPAKGESYKAVDKLLASLYSVGSYKMEIVNSNSVSSTSLPNTFNDAVKAEAKSKNLI